VKNKFDEAELGQFAWIIEPDGNKAGSWEPPSGQ